MEDQIRSYRTIGNNVKLFLLLGGVWPKVRHDGIFYRAFGILSAFTCIFSGIKVLYFCLSNIEDITIVTTALGPFISAFTTTIKVISFLVYRSNVIDLNHSLGKAFDDDLKIAHYQPLLLSGLAILTRPVYFLVYSLFFTIFSYTVTPIVLMVTSYKFTFIYPGKYPFPFEPGGTVYFVLFGLDIMTSWYVGIVTSGVDGAFGFYAFQICGQFRVLAMRFRSLRYDHNYAAELKSCVEKHFALMRYRDDMRCVFGLLVIWLVVTGALVLCGLIYQAVEITVSIRKLVTFVTYALMKFLQCFIYAYYGAQISAESELCKNAIYESDWTNFKNKRIRNDLLIITTQKPAIIKVFGYFIVSLDMFVKILNTTISYFFLLQTLADST